MSSRESKPAVLFSCFVIFLCAAVVIFPHSIVLTVVLCTIGVLCTFAILLICKRRLYAFLLAFLFILATSASYVSYLTSEGKAESFISAFGDAEHTFTASVSDCSVSGNFVSFRLKLLTVDGRTLSKSFMASADTFSGDYAEKGDLLTFKGRVTGPDEASGSVFDNKTYLKSKGIFIYLPSISVISSNVGKSQTFLDLSRLYIRNVIYKYLPKDFSYTTSSLACAIIYGDRSGISRDIRTDFTRSGLTHLLCISGMHLTVILGFFAFLLRQLSLHLKTKYALLSAACVFYIFLTGCTMSVLRAGIMALISYLAVLSGRKYEPVSALFTSGALICLLNPYAVFDISAQLSFLSTLGILCFASFSDSYRVSRLVLPARVIVKALILNFGAVIFTIPLSAFCFEGISLVSFFSTLFVSIPCELALILLLLLVILSPFGFLSPICISAGRLCDLLLSYVVYVARRFSSYRLAFVESRKSVATILIFACLVILLCLFLSVGKSRAEKYMRFSLTALCAIICTISLIYTVGVQSESKTFYYRKNSMDRELSIKSGTDGVLLVNADNVLCTNPDKLYFDTFSGRNSLLIIPDSSIEPSILSHNIEVFGERFGLEFVYVPESPEGKALAAELSRCGTSCSLFPKYLLCGKDVIKAEVGDITEIEVRNSKSSSFYVFSDSYSRDYFSGYYDVCAFFNRDSKKQFNVQSDEVPDCSVFYTRLKKGETRQNIQNTFGKTSFEIVK